VAGGSRLIHLYTSGHATAEDIKKVCEITQAKTIIPIHGEKPKVFDRLGLSGEVRILRDGEAWTL